MVKAEQRGLERIAACQCIAAPTVHGIDSLHPEEALIVLDYVEPATPTQRSWERFGRELANLHRNTSVYFGSVKDNFIGLLPQSNQSLRKWSDFYREQRLRPQVSLAKSQGLLDSHDLKKMDRLYMRLSNILCDEKPALLHGDLWNGNFLVDGSDCPWLLDPSSYFGHREVDLAMTRLFGGFSEVFYASYAESFSLAPNWQERIEIYQLYYILVHLNLFGKGYLGSVRKILDRYSR